MLDPSRPLAPKLYKDGKWTEGKAAPKQLRADLAALPSDLVTDEIADEKRIHEHDPEHVQAQILDDYTKEQGGEGVKFTARDLADLKAYAKPGDHLPLTAMGPDRRQVQVDLVRLRIIGALVESALRAMENGGDVDLHAVRHVWFPRDSIQAYELRDGNPPPDSKRPAWAKGIDLVIDLTNPPRRIKSMLTKYGVDLMTPEEMERAASPIIQI